MQCTRLQVVIDCYLLTVTCLNSYLFAVHKVYSFIKWCGLESPWNIYLKCFILWYLLLSDWFSQLIMYVEASQQTALCAWRWWQQEWWISLAATSLSLYKYMGLKTLGQRYVTLLIYYLFYGNYCHSTMFLTNISCRFLQLRSLVCYTYVISWTRTVFMK